MGVDDAHLEYMRFRFIRVGLGGQILMQRSLEPWCSNTASVMTRQCLHFSAASLWRQKHIQNMNNFMRNVGLEL